MPDNAKTPQLCFILFYRDDRNKISMQFKHIRETAIFSGANATSSLDKFVELINRCINYFIGGAERDPDIDCRLLYGNFVIENDTLQYKYIS